MKTQITGSNVWPNSFFADDDGEPRDAAGVLVGFGALADRTKYLYERLVNGFGGVTLGNATASSLIVINSLQVPSILATTVTSQDFVYSPAKTVNRVVNIAHGFHSGTWGQTAISPAGCWTNTTTSGRLVIELDVRTGDILHEVRVTYRGGTGHSGSNPGTMPSISLATIDESETATVIASQNDVTPAAGFESVHGISITGLNVAVDRSTKRYQVYINAESGANAQTGAIVSAVRVNYTMTNAGAA